MARRDPEDLHGIPVDMLRHQVRERERHREPLQTDFDGHLPEAGDAEESFVGAVLDELTRIGAKGSPLKVAGNIPLCTL